MATRTTRRTTLLRPRRLTSNTTGRNRRCRAKNSSGKQLAFGVEIADSSFPEGHLLSHSEAAASDEHGAATFALLPRYRRFRAISVGIPGGDGHEGRQ